MKINEKNARKQAMNQNTYWRENLKLLKTLLVIWFCVSFGFGIILVDWLDQFTFFGFKLGFWFAQQGSIYVFVILIFIYSWRMNILDKNTTKIITPQVMSTQELTYIFVGLSFALYIFIAIASRVKSTKDFYVAGSESIQL